MDSNPVCDPRTTVTSCLVDITATKILYYTYTLTHFINTMYNNNNKAQPYQSYYVRGSRIRVQ